MLPWVCAFAHAEWSRQRVQRQGAWCILPQFCNLSFHFSNSANWIDFLSAHASCFHFSAIGHRLMVGGGLCLSLIYSHWWRVQDGRTALISAVEKGHSACVRVLLEGGADKEAKDHVRDDIFFLKFWFLWCDLEWFYEFAFAKSAWKFIFKRIFLFCHFLIQHLMAVSKFCGIVYLYFSLTLTARYFLFNSCAIWIYLDILIESLF